MEETGLKEGVQFATLTDILTKAWADKTTKEYKILKGLKKENLRDNMTNTELILNMLAEASTKDISTAVNPKDLEESKKVAEQGGNVAKVARKEQFANKEARIRLKRFHPSIDAEHNTRLLFWNQQGINHIQPTKDAVNDGP